MIDSATSASAGSEKNPTKTPVQHCVFKDSRTVVPTMSFLSTDSEKVEAIIGADAATELKHPATIRDVILSGYKNFRLQPKKDIVCDRDDVGWNLTLKGRLGEERIDCEGATSHFFRALFKDLESGTLLQEYGAQDIYIGKPAFQDTALERRYVHRITSIFSTIGFKQKPSFVYEPYAIIYYCQHIAGIKFFPTGKRRRTRILVIDHGGGTLSSCIVELSTAGEVDLSARPVRPISLDNAGGRRLDEVILHQVIIRSKLNDGQKRRLIARDHISFLLVDSALLAIESAKIRCVEEHRRSARDASGIPLKIEFGIDDIPAIDVTLGIADVREAFLALWRQKWSDAISFTIKGESAAPGLIDHVIVAGGTCKTGFHRDLLTKHFGSAFVPDATQFVDISDEKTPVVEGICCQALLDFSKTHDVSPEAEKLAASQNLADVVANDVVIAMLGCDQGENRNRLVLGQGTLIPAGKKKTEVWSVSSKIQVPLKEKLPRRFGLNIYSRNTLEADGPEHSSFPITIRKERFGDRQRTVAVSLSVNEEGICHPEIAVAPTKAPNYLEPDHKRFHFDLPDLMKRDISARSDGGGERRKVLGIDFGSVMTCAACLDLSAFIEPSRLKSWNTASNYSVGLFTPASVDLQAEGSSLDDLTNRLVNALRRIESKMGEDFETFMMRFGDADGAVGPGQAAVLRSCVEKTLNGLAPEGDMKKARIAPKFCNRPVGSQYSRSQKVQWVLRHRAHLQRKEASRIEKLTQDMIDVLYARTSNVVHGEVVLDRRELERIVNLFKSAMCELIEV